MLGEELRPGLWRWSAGHEEWRRPVASVAVEAGEDLVLIDPLLEESQWASLERAARGRAVHVVISVHWHGRSAAAVAERLPGTRVWAHSSGRAAVARRAPVSDVFRAGEELPGGLVPSAVRPRSEVVLWAPRARALIAGDALLGDGERGEGLHTCPASWLPQSTNLDDLRAALRPVLDLPVEIVLPSHGEPVLAGGGRALAQALG